MASADAPLGGDELRERRRTFHAHQFHHQISGLRRIWKTGDLLGTRLLHAGSRGAQIGGAVVVNQNDPDAVVSTCRQIAGDATWREELSQQAERLHRTLFNPDRLQEIFVSEIEKLVRSRARASTRAMS